MTLRRQLLLVSLLLLSLPWAGCQFIREMEGALRQGQTQALQATAEAVAAVLAAQESNLYVQPERRMAEGDDSRDLYAGPASGPVILDGYGDGWESVPPRTFGDAADNTSLGVQVRAQTRGDNLYLLFDVTDDRVVYHNPGLSPEANGDRLILRLWANGRRQDYVVATAAPGSVRARFDGRRQRGLDPGRISGFWQDSMQGYSLELVLPLAYTGGRLGFFLIDEDSHSPRGDRSVGNTARMAANAPPWLIYQPARLQALLDAFGNRAGSIEVVDRHAWRLASFTGEATAEEDSPETFWLLRLLYRTILTSGELPSPPDPPLHGKLAGDEVTAALAGSDGVQRYRDSRAGPRTLLSVAAPILDARGLLGAVVVRQSAETYLSLTDKAFSRLLGYSLAALAIAAVGLLAFATVLSLRIRALSRAAAGAIGDDGRVTGNFSASRADDEIGDLSRQYDQLLSRLKEYNDYLRSLSRKLAHELRTPIAVIQSSLDNLDHVRNDPERSTYLRRAREGLGRLQYILTAMSEANRLEESVHNQPKTVLDLVPMLRQLVESYRAVYSDHSLLLVLQVNSARIEGVAELLVQALDKLLDNAASFAPPGSEIEIKLDECQGGWRLGVSNRGPLLPPNETARLFEPMVSERETGEDVHLGLGLHIVRLIVEFHGGEVRAANLPEESGVIVSVTLPGLTGEPS